MKERIWLQSGLFLLMVLGGTGFLLADQPVIDDSDFQNPSLQLMMPNRFSVSPVGARLLNYQWEIVEPPNGRFYGHEGYIEIPNLTNRHLRIDPYWGSEDTAEQLLGRQVQLKLVVSFQNPQEGDETLEKFYTLTVDSINHPPEPIIRFCRFENSELVCQFDQYGSPDERIPAGGSLSFDSFSTTDPDGPQAFSSSWVLGSYSGCCYTSPRGPIVGTEGASASWGIPEMSGFIDQKLELIVVEGLHMVKKTATAYLAPSNYSVPGSNRRPTISPKQTLVSVSKGGLALLEATGSDPDGDPIRFIWKNASSGAAITSGVTSTASSTRLQISTTSMTSGQYRYSVVAKETVATGLQSDPAYITLNIRPPGGTGPGFFEEEPEVCSPNQAPTIISIDPDPRSSKIYVYGGETAKIELRVEDRSQKTVSSPWGDRTVKGISEVVWDTDDLKALGISASSRLTGGSSDYEAISTLTMSIPQNASGDAILYADVSDIEDCSNQIGIGVTVIPASSPPPSSDNQSPVAKIRYDAGSGWVGPVTNGYITDVTHGTIVLDGSASTDNVGIVSYEWSRRNMAVASFSNTTSQQTTLTIPSDALSDVVKVDLVVKDAAGNSSQSTIEFNVSEDGSSNPGSGGGIDQNKQVCSNNSAPTFVSLNPDPSLAEIELQGGNSSQIDIIFEDSSTVTISGLAGVGTRKGIDTIEWDFSELSQAFGVTGSAQYVATSLERRAQSRLTLNVPKGARGNATIRVTATDVEGCSNTVSFPVRLGTPPAANAPPIAVLRYDVSGSGNFTAIDNGGSVPMDRYSVDLQSNHSDDDKGKEQLTHSWQILGIGGGPGQPVLSATMGTDTSLMVPEGFKGTVTIQLTVADSDEASTSTQATFNFQEPPVARISYDLEGAGEFSEPMEGNLTGVKTPLRKVYLDASGSSDDFGPGNLTYEWKVRGNESVGFSSTSGPSTVLQAALNTEGWAAVDLIVTDSSGLSSRASLPVKFLERQNQAPRAQIRIWHLGEFVPYESGSSYGTRSTRVIFDAKESTDDIENQLTYRWSLPPTPAEDALEPTLENTSGVETVLNWPEGTKGRATVQLEVTDSEGAVGTAFVTVVSQDPPVARIRYSEGGEGELQGPLAKGKSIRTRHRKVLVDALASTNDNGNTESMTFKWVVTGLSEASLTDPEGAQTLLEVPAGASGWATARLTVTDAYGMKGKSALPIFFEENEPPEARIRYDENGDGLFSGPFSEGHSVTVGPGTVVLDASRSSDNDSEGELTFLWALSGLEGAQLSDENAVKTDLTVPVNKAGTITVTLTVTDPFGATHASNIEFQVIKDYDPPVITALIAPQSVESGEEFEVSATVKEGSNEGELAYFWSATCSMGKSIRIYNGGERAKLRAPTIQDPEDTEPFINLKLEVFDGISWAKPVTKQIALIRSNIFFAEIGVGQYDNSREIQTAVVLLNSSDIEATGELLFYSGEEGAEWTVEVDGSSNRSRQQFSIKPGEAQEFLLTGVGGFQLGWMSIKTNVNLNGHVLYRVVSIPEGYLLDETPILPAKVGRVFKTLLGKGPNSEVGFVVVNIDDKPMMFKVTASENGEEGFSQESFNRILEPREQAAEFLSDFLRPFALPDDFNGGTLTIHTTGGQGKLAVIVVKQSDHGLPWTFLPVAVIE